jgi:hypothetical protein
LLYQNCRWYDLYPKLGFVLQLLQLVPVKQQVVIGFQLSQYLLHRSIMLPVGLTGLPRGNRWYDQVESLVISLEQLKSAPHPIKQQTTDFLMRHLKEIRIHPSESFCA